MKFIWERVKYIDDDIESNDKDRVEWDCW